MGDDVQRIKLRVGDRFAIEVDGYEWNAVVSQVIPPKETGSSVLQREKALHSGGVAGVVEYYPCEVTFAVDSQPIPTLDKALEALALLGNMGFDIRDLTESVVRKASGDDTND